MVIFRWQMGHYGTASYENPLSSYLEHIPNKPLDIGADIASSAEGLHGWVERDDVAKAPRRIIEPGYIAQTSRYPLFDEMIDESGGVIVAANVVVQAGQGDRPASHVQDAPVKIDRHLVQIALKPISSPTTISSTTYQIYAPRFSQKRSVTGEMIIKPDPRLLAWYGHYSLGRHILFSKNNRFLGRDLTRPAGRGPGVQATRSP